MSQRQGIEERALSAQRGFVSIIVAALLMIILSLIVAGFTRVMQREQRQAIDRQLSRTALYAAESGVNDVLNAISAGVPAYSGTDKNDCAPGAIGPLGDGRLIADGSIAYTCTLFDQTPGELSYDMEADESKIVRLESVGGTNFGALEVSWGQRDGTQDATTLPDCSANSVFQYPASRPDNVPVLRLDITKLPAGSFNRDDLLNSTEYMYLIPCRVGTTSTSHPHSFDATSRGDVIAVPCNTAAPQPCRARIENIAAAGGTSQLFARIKSVYAPAQVSVDGEDTGGNPIEFAGAQIAVDVTARAGDIVRRLAVSVPFDTTVDVPEVALQVFDGICKRIDLSFLGTGDVDRCNAVSTPPTPTPPGPTPPTPPAAGTCPSATAQTITMNLSQAALISAGGDTRAAVRSIDVVSDPLPSDGTMWDGWHFTTPDLNFASLSGYSADAFRVNSDCSYIVDYTAFCGSPTDTGTITGNVWGTPPIQDCDLDQINEGMRVNFYSAFEAADPQQCDWSTRVAYFDVEDHFTTLAPSDITITGVSPTITGAGNIVCTEIHSSCEVSATHPGCNDPSAPRRSSVFMHSISWTESP